MKERSTTLLYRLLTLSLLLSSIIGNIVSAQDLTAELISYPNKGLEQLSTKHRQVVSELTLNSDARAHLVRLNPIKESVSNNVITVSLPDGEGRIRIVLDKIEYYDSKNYVVVGKVENSLLTAIFSSHDGNKGGLIQGMKTTYEIYDLEEEGQLLVGSSNAARESNFCGIEKSTTQPDPLPVTELKTNAGDWKSDANARIDACYSNTRVLFLYTTGVSLSVAQSLAYNTIDALNTTISQSNVNNSLAYAQIAAITSTSYTSSSPNDIRADALNLSNNSAVQALRDLHKADLVLLISNFSYTNGSKGGVPAPEVIAHPNNGRAYGIISLPNGADQIIAAHELSHLYGCNHEDVAYGLYYSKAIVYNAGGQKTATLVASGPGGAGASRLLRYSYPTITGSGPALTDRNNTQVMNVNAGGVKNFRPEPNQLSAYIEGPYSGIAYHMYTYEAVTSCGSAPYSYQWRVSTDGFNYGSVLGTGEFFNTHLYHNGNHNFYLKLTATSADNQTRETTHQVYVNDNGSGYRIGVPENKEESSKDEIVYPNPVTSFANITLNMVQAGKVTVDIYSASGIKIASPIKQTMEVGNHTLTISLEKYRMADGTYLIKVQTPEGLKTHKIDYHHALN